MADEIVILITASSRDEAGKLAKTLVDEHLAACVNVLPAVESYFFWEGKTQSAQEILLICKSRMPLMEKLTARVKTLHSYTVPEIIALPIVAGLPAYLSWVQDSTKG